MTKTTNSRQRSTKLKSIRNRDLQGVPRLYIYNKYKDCVQFIRSWVKTSVSYKRLVATTY